MLNVKPITTLTDGDQALICLYPSVYGGLEIVRCTRQSGVLNVEHDCPICQHKGHIHCPYVDNAIRIVSYISGKYPLYKVTKKKMVLKPDWKQHPALSVKNSKKVSVAQ